MPVAVPVAVRARGCHRAAAAASMALGRGARSSSPARMAPAAGTGRCHGCAALTSERLKGQRPGSQAAAPAGAEGLQGLNIPLWQILHCHSRCAAGDLTFVSQILWQCTRQNISMTTKRLATNGQTYTEQPMAAHTVTHGIKQPPCLPHVVP